MAHSGKLDPHGSRFKPYRDDENQRVATIAHDALPTANVALSNTDGVDVVPIVLNRDIFEFNVVKYGNQEKYLPKYFLTPRMNLICWLNPVHC